MMWIRYAVFCVFAWLVVRRRGGLVRAARSRRPWLQASRALLAVIESAVFVLALRYLPLADTHAVAATSPLIVIAYPKLVSDGAPRLPIRLEFPLSLGTIVIRRVS